jgi:hypothetical protein
MSTATYVPTSVQPLPLDSSCVPTKTRKYVIIKATYETSFTAETNMKCSKMQFFCSESKVRHVLYVTRLERYITSPVENTNSAFALFTLVLIYGRHEHGKATQFFDTPHFVTRTEV